MTDANTVMPALQAERRVRIKEICARLTIGRRTLYRRIAEGLYPPLLRDGGIAFYLESMLLKLLRGGQA